jgi:predicted XRE-type DNA-binding protein
MSDELELVRGSENPFADVGLPEADTKLIKADLAAEIVGVLRERHLTGAAAAKLVGIQTADISRIRNADLARFTIDRLVHILNRLNRHVEMRVTVKAAPVEHASPSLT